jgi:hypothetical protein
MSLPIAGPYAAVAVRQRKAERAMRQRAVVEAAVIFKPSRV